MNIDFQLMNMLLIFGQTFIIPMIVIVFIVEIMIHLYKLESETKNKFRQKIYFLFVILFGLLSLSSMYGTAAPRIVHESTYIPNGNEKTISEIVPNNLVDSTTMETLKQQTVEQENKQNEKLEKQGVDLTTDN